MPPINCLTMEGAVKMYLGIPPHDGPENYYRGDIHFANQIEIRFNQCVDDLAFGLQAKWDKEALEKEEENLPTPELPQTDDLTLYAVRNKEGKWFRRKGYGGYGETWTEDFSAARVYNKPGPARGVVSWFANRYPEYGAPDLVALKISEVVVLDEAERVKTKRESRAAREKKADERRAKEKLEYAQREYDKAKANLESFKPR